jgi:hypothetical protein
MTKDMVRLLEKSSIQFIDVAEAKARWFQFRLDNGWKSEAKMLSRDKDNAKLGKSAKAGYPSLGLALAPHKYSGEFNVCRYATPVCSASCVAFAGNGFYPKILQARILKTRFLAHDPSAFITIVADEIDTHVRKHGKVAVRLNTFSDLPWERLVPDLFTRWGEKVTFYDYTKWPASERPEQPGYDLTRSATERTTNAEIVKMVRDGERVAVVLNIRKKDPVSTFEGLTAIDGDKSDARFAEPKSVVVVLRPKGRARTNGFFREPVA